MKPEALQHLLQQVRDREISLEKAYRHLKSFIYEDLTFAKIDHHRTFRLGFPEIIFCQGKTPAQIISIMQRLVENGEGKNILATRAGPEVFSALRRVIPQAQYNEMARAIYIKQPSEKFVNEAIILVMSAGTADIPVAEEAGLTAEVMGHQVKRLYDIGVAGLHRFLDNLDLITSANVIIAVAGMEGALPSVVGGLVDKPVIAVPTSVGYGANFKGLSALLSMLNSCAPGVTVVNIDNGFGAGYAAALITRCLSSIPREKENFHG